jgi:hypothetical protein
VTRRRKVLVVVAALAVVGVAATAAARLRTGDPDGAAARLFGPLPGGYRYVKMEGDEAAATTKLFRSRNRASDVTLVETPLDLAPIGVTVVALVFAAPPDPVPLAQQLDHDVPLDDPKPKTVGGQPVLGHEGDATLSSATLWVHRRLAIVTYGSTTAEVDGALAAVLASGAWQSHPAV